MGGERAVKMVPGREVDVSGRGPKGVWGCGTAEERACKPEEQRCATDLQTRRVRNREPEGHK